MKLPYHKFRFLVELIAIVFIAMMVIFPQYFISKLVIMWCAIAGAIKTIEMLE